MTFISELQGFSSYRDNEALILLSYAEGYTYLITKSAYHNMEEPRVTEFLNVEGITDINSMVTVLEARTNRSVSDQAALNLIGNHQVTVLYNTHGLCFKSIAFPDQVTRYFHQLFSKNSLLAERAWYPIYMLVESILTKSGNPEAPETQAVLDMISKAKAVDKAAVLFHGILKK